MVVAEKRSGLFSLAINKPNFSGEIVGSESSVEDSYSIAQNIDKRG